MRRCFTAFSAGKSATFFGRCWACRASEAIRLASILSAFTADEVRTIIAAGQADVLKSVKGLGIKTAQKIIVELRDKIGAVCPANEALPLRQAADGTFDEALSALTMLGFARQASEKALRALRKEMPAATVEELVRQALKRL